MATTRPEPFRIKMVESIHLISREERERKLKEAGYNVFKLKIEDIYIDLLTDSGTSAMSDQQWAEMIISKQAYAGGDSFYKLEDAMKDIFGFKHFIPVHQGRVAENMLFSTVVKEGNFVPSNMHFDTTEGNIMNNKGIPVNLICDDAYDTGCQKPFKGNMNIKKLEHFIQEKGPENIPIIMLTITNNTGGGQPVSMANIKAVSEVAKKYNLPFFLDACRFAENAYFIQEREEGYKDKSIREISKEMFSYADGCTFSGKKEALSNIGGMLCMNDEKIHEKVRNMMVIIEGFTTYGGMACRDLAAMARGLYEVTEQSYQEYRHYQVQYLWDLLNEAGVPLIAPCGGHAVFIDGIKFLPHIPADQFPSQALTAQLYIEYGIRGVELGASAFGKWDENDNFILPKLDTMRLTIPRRRYTNSHMEYVAKAVIDLYKNRSKIKGLKRTYAPRILGHFLASFEPIE